MTPVRYHSLDLHRFAAALLEKGGLAYERANVVGEILLEGDLLGHTTHGLQLLAAYLTELDTGRMARDGEPQVIADHPAALTWEGNFLPGPWLTVRAMETAFERIAEQPVV